MPPHPEEEETTWWRAALSQMVTWLEMQGPSSGRDLVSWSATMADWEIFVQWLVTKPWLKDVLALVTSTKLLPAGGFSGGAGSGFALDQDGGGRPLSSPRREEQRVLEAMRARRRARA